MNIILAVSALGASAAVLAPRGFDERAVHPAKNMPPGSYEPLAGIALSSPPPRPLKDVIQTPGYAKGHFQSVGAFWDKGGNIKHELYDPASNTTVYQWHTAKGGQGEGFS